MLDSVWMEKLSCGTCGLVGSLQPSSYRLSCDVVFFCQNTASHPIPRRCFNEFRHANHDLKKSRKEENRENNEHLVPKPFTSNCHFCLFVCSVQKLMQFEKKEKRRSRCSSTVSKKRTPAGQPEARRPCCAASRMSDGAHLYHGLGTPKN